MKDVDIRLLILEAVQSYEVLVDNWLRLVALFSSMCLNEAVKLDLVVYHVVILFLQVIPRFDSFHYNGASFSIGG